MDHFALYFKLTRRFFNFCGNILKDKLYVTNYDPTVHSKELISAEFASKLNNELNLESFGEYNSACVRTWRNYLAQHLTSKGHRIISSRTIKEYSLAGCTNLDSDSLDLRLQKGRQNRKARERICVLLRKHGPA